MNQTIPNQRVKISVFIKQYYKDAHSRPCKRTIIRHIEIGLLSGEKIGGLWYVLCNDWGQPLYYGEPPTPEPITQTGNSRADAILKDYLSK
jgi:hypothetical protein